MHGRPLPGRTVDMDLAARLLNKTLNHRQTQATALTAGFGGKVRLQSSRYHIWRHAFTIVANRYHDIESIRQR